MKKAILSLILFCFITAIQAENTTYQVDSLKSLLKTAKNDTTKVKILNELSAYLVDMDSYSEALVIGIQAKELAEKLKFNSGIATALRRIGIAYTCKGEYPVSLKFLFQALKVAESIKDSYLIGKICNSIGSNYNMQKDYESALKYFFRSLSFYYNPVVYQDIARTYHLQGKDELAVEYYNKALSYKMPLIEKAFILNDLGDIYEQQNKLDSALTYYFKALKITNELQNDAGMCDANGSIGDLLLKQKKYKDAIFYHNKSLVIAKKINSKYSIVQSEKSLSEIYNGLGNKEKSFEHYKNYISVRDSMFNEENTRQTVRTEMNFDFDKKQAIQKAEQDSKDALANSEFKRQQTQRNAFILGMFIVIVFSIFLFRAFKRNQKAKNIITEQKKNIEHKTKEITDSISYAKNIQGAMLPSQEYLQNAFSDVFTIYEPKDIVSGDFYWSFKEGDSTYFATADCTGHGVPGAMMSMLACSLLNEIVIERKITSPNQVLNTLREEIIKALNPKGSMQERKDGLDISFSRLNGMVLQSACANNGIYIVREGTLIEIKTDRFPVGKYVTDLPFTLNTTELKKGDIIYTLSDGFCDQFGGEKGKKLMTRKFKEWILELSCLEMSFIKIELEARFHNWIGDGEQVDDVTVFAIKV